MIQYYYTKKEWGVVMEKEELKILEELRRILNSKNEAIVILNNYFKGGVGKSKLSTMFAYLTDKFNLKVLMIDKDLQATLTKDLAKTFKVELPRVNFYEGLKNGKRFTGAMLGIYVHGSFQGRFTDWSYMAE